MKILITVGIYPPDIGGPASFVPRIAKLLEQNECEVTVICLSNEKILVDAEEAIKKDNFELATEKLLALPKPVRVQMMEWLELAEDRLNAYRLLTDLKQLVFVELSQKK